jgi:DeoR family fructose operon transcriptional repressor
MKAAERQLRIQELFSSQEFVDVETLCRVLEASESTVRRDLSELEKTGFLRRVHGGALSLQSRDDLLDFQRQSVRCQEEKKRIGKVAAGLVEDEQTVILDGGSTVAEVARNLLGRRLHIVTNSIPIAEIFSDSRSVELTGAPGFSWRSRHHCDRFGSGARVPGIGAREGNRAGRRLKKTLATEKDREKQRKACFRSTP